MGGLYSGLAAVMTQTLPGRLPMLMRGRLEVGRWARALDT